jgi:hypothetical protein
MFLKVLFLKLARILALFLILLHKFLTEGDQFSTPPGSFYSKVMADGTAFPVLAYQYKSNRVAKNDRSCLPVTLVL